MGDSEMTRHTIWLALNMKYFNWQLTWAMVDQRSYILEQQLTPRTKHEIRTGCFKYQD